MVAFRNRIHFDFPVINATSNSLDGRGKSDEDVLYQKGASFSAKLANDDGGKSMAKSTFALSASQSASPAGNENGEDESGSEGDSYDYGELEDSNSETQEQKQQSLNLQQQQQQQQQHKNINLSTSRGPNNCKIANSPNKSLPKINNTQSMGHSTCNLLAHPAHFAMPVPSITGDFQIITEMPNHFCGLAVVSYIYACIHTYVCISQLPTPSPIPIPIPS